jgi:hypothetical protein
MKMKGLKKLENLKRVTLSYSQKINSYLYPKRVSPPLKNRCAIFSEGNAAHPGGCDSPLQIIQKWRFGALLFESELAGSGETAHRR